MFEDPLLYRKTLLCVEKDGGRVKARCVALEGAGYRVICADNLAEALKIFVSETIDVVLLDARFGVGKKDSPGVLMNNIRPHVPIIVMCDEKERVRRGVFAEIFRKREGNRALLRIVQEVVGDEKTSLRDRTRIMEDQ